MVAFLLLMLYSRGAVWFFMLFFAVAATISRHWQSERSS
jgi:hypothetical protein